MARDRHVDCADKPTAGERDRQMPVGIHIDLLPIPGAPKTKVRHPGKQQAGRETAIAIKNIQEETEPMMGIRFMGLAEQLSQSCEGAHGDFPKCSGKEACPPDKANRNNGNHQLTGLTLVTSTTWRDSPPPSPGQSVNARPADNKPQNSDQSICL